MKTFSQKPADVTRTWYVVDATGVPLGRLATEVSRRLVGKHKVTYTPHTDGGDYIVVVNSDKVVLTGAKEDSKTYYRHSGYIGNLKERTAAEQRELDSRKLITDAVKGMLPKNKLSNGRLDRLKVYKDADHTHAPQQPKEMTIKTGKKA